MKQIKLSKSLHYEDFKKMCSGVGYFSDSLYYIKGIRLPRGVYGAKNVGNNVYELYHTKAGVVVEVKLV